MKKDDTNKTYTESVDNVYSEDGIKYHTEKYAPKHNFIDKYIQKGNFTLLDIGVGYGTFLHITEKRYPAAKLFGLDPYLKSIEYSQEHTTADIREGRIEDNKWPFDNKFDVITCFDVIEHLEEPADFFRNIKDSISSTSIIICSTPNKEFGYRLRAIPGFGIPDDNTTHINVHPPKYWKKLAEQHGFEILEKWKGEHLTHIRFIPNRAMSLFKMLKIDHRKLPIVNSFEQAFNFVLKLK